MEAPKCVATLTYRDPEDQTDPRSLPAPRTYTCDRQDKPWHRVHRDPEKGLWRGTIHLPLGKFEHSLD
jgi:hypothetical protein